VPFILPVVIDETGEPEALVPDRFCKVQWTRLPGGHVPPEVAARFLTLYSHRTAGLTGASVRPEALPLLPSRPGLSLHSRPLRASNSRRQSRENWPVTTRRWAIWPRLALI
jgi:hypothetical protein